MRIGEAALAFGVGAAVTFLVIRATPSCSPEPGGGIARVDTVRDTTWRHDTIPKLVVVKLPAKIETLRVGGHDSVRVATATSVVGTKDGYVDTVSAAYFFPPANYFSLAVGYEPRRQMSTVVTVTRDSIVYRPMPREWWRRIAIGPGVGAFYNGERVIYAPAIAVTYDVLP